MTLTPCSTLTQFLCNFISPLITSSNRRRDRSSPSKYMSHRRVMTASASSTRQSASLKAVTSLTQKAPYPSSNVLRMKPKCWSSCWNYRTHPTFAPGMIVSKALHPAPSAVYPLILTFFCTSSQSIFSCCHTCETYPFDCVIYQAHWHHHVLVCDTTASSIQYK